MFYTIVSFEIPAQHYIRIMFMRVFLMCCIGLVHSSAVSLAEIGLAGREQVVLAGAAARVGIDRAGGSIVDFRLADSEVTPLTWNYPEVGDRAPRTMGHFLCLDRWGNPSPQERENGMPFHGEASYIMWEVVSPPEKKGETITAVMSCELPLGGLRVMRMLVLNDTVPVLQVREEITNLNKLGRVYNMVQHATIAPPFLDRSVMVDSNAYRGFLGESSMPFPEEPVVYWPVMAYKGKLVDMRRFEGDHNPAVVSYVFADSLVNGWVTACNPAKGFLIGYIWERSEYPWLVFWRNAQNGEPAARGLEFGTTGLHLPFAELTEKGEVFGTPVFAYLDAGETVTKSYTAFLAEIPGDYRGVEEVSWRDGSIVIRERGAPRSDIILKLR